MPLTDEHRAAQAAFNRNMSQSIVSYEALLRKRAARFWGIEESWWGRLLVRVGLRRPRPLPILRVPDDGPRFVPLTAQDAERYGSRGLWLNAGGERALYPDERG